jgi:hypothetical protein
VFCADTASLHSTSLQAGSEQERNKWQAWDDWDRVGMDWDVPIETTLGHIGTTLGRIGTKAGVAGSQPIADIAESP